MDHFTSMHCEIGKCSEPYFLRSIAISALNQVNEKNTQVKKNSVSIPESSFAILNE